ncbi:MAG: hypothetical protein R3B48_16155 [Kofleriaceae bacterium]
MSRHVTSRALAAAGLFLVAFVAAQLPESSVALAQPSAKLDAARRHFEQGEAYFRAGAFADAAAAYRAAYDAVPKAVLWFNIGLAWENHGDREAALAAYDRYLAAEPNGVKAVEARARRAALVTGVEEARAERARAERAAALREQAKAHASAGRHDQAVQALRDANELVPDPEIDFALAAEYRAAGDAVREESALRRYTERDGAHRDDAAARLRELEDARAAKEAEQARAASLTQPAPPRRKLPALIALSTGGVALAVAVGYGLRARSIGDELDQDLRDGKPPVNTADPRFAQGERAALISNVSLGVASVALLAGGYLAVRAWRPGTQATALRAQPPKRELSLAPLLSPGRAGLAVEVGW